MEILTGIMIAGFIYYTGIMVSTGEIEINNFYLLKGNWQRLTVIRLTSAFLAGGSSRYSL